MERNQNYVELWGVAAGEPVFSHTSAQFCWCIL